MLTDVYLEVLNTLFELIEVESARIVVIHDFELSSQSNHTSSSSLLKLISESLYLHALKLWSRLGVLNDYLRGCLLLWPLSWLWLISTLEWVSWWHILLGFLLEFLILLNNDLFFHGWVRVHHL